MAHTYRWEGGGAAVLGSIQPQPLRSSADGSLALADIEAAIKPDDAALSRARACWRWRTPGAARCCRCPTSKRPVRWPRQGPGHAPGRRTPVQRRGGSGHADGAHRRRHFDSVSVCFSKGLGAPAGSRWCGSRRLIARAHRVRKMLGGGMRQAGVLAAAALHALDHHVERLAEDHAHARRWPTGLQGCRASVVQRAADQHRLRRPGARQGPALSSGCAMPACGCTGLYRLRSGHPPRREPRPTSSARVAVLRAHL
jgi:threonine aldolase